MKNTSYPRSCHMSIEILEKTAIRAKTLRKIVEMATLSLEAQLRQKQNDRALLEAREERRAEQAHRLAQYRASELRRRLKQIEKQVLLPHFRR